MSDVEPVRVERSVHGIFLRPHSSASTESPAVSLDALIDAVERGQRRAANYNADRIVACPNMGKGEAAFEEWRAVWPFRHERELVREEVCAALSPAPELTVGDDAPSRDLLPARELPRADAVTVVAVEDLADLPRGTVYTAAADGDDREWTKDSYELWFLTVYLHRPGRVGVADNALPLPGIARTPEAMTK